MTDGNGVRWFTVRALAAASERSPKTIRRLARAYRADCRLVRQGQHPRKVLFMPESVANAILETILSRRNRSPLT